MTAKAADNKIKAPPRSILLWILFWIYAAFFVVLILTHYVSVAWLSFFTANRILFTGLSFLCLGFVLTGAAVYGLVKMRYAAVTAFFCLALLARCCGFAVSFCFSLLKQGSFWHLPLGDAGIPLFYLIAIGGLDLAGRVADKKKNPLLFCLIPAVCYLVPVFFLISGLAGGAWPVIYSFVYATPLVITLALVIRHWPGAELRGTGATLIILVIIDFTRFLYWLPAGGLIPDGFSEAIAPLGLILFTLNLTGRREEPHG